MRAQDVALRYRVIGVGRKGGVLSQLDSLLADSQGELYVVSKGRAAVEMVKTLGPVDLILVEFPLHAASLEDFLGDLYRLVEVPPRVAVMSSDRDGDGLPDLSAWNCVVLSFDRSLEKLAAALEKLLERAPRVAARLMVRLEVMAEAEQLLRLAQTENISKTGMLLRTEERFPRDAAVRFELSFPEDPEPLRGRARVVRRVDPGRERMRGVGVRFQALLGTDQLRLERFLERALLGESRARDAEPLTATAVS